MFVYQGVRVASACRRRLVVVIVSVLPLLGGLALASSASAAEPSGDFAAFKQCPRFAAGVELCMYTQTLSGEVVLGKQVVPFVSPITLQGGITAAGSSSEGFVGALNGETLSRTPQKVPGGLLGVVNCAEIKGSGFFERIRRRTCEAVFESRVTSVSATTELARPASEIAISTNNLANQEGAAVTMPVRIHLENPLLGRECYIGSSANPVVLNLTSGTTSPPAPNTPISGKVGEIKFKDNYELLEVTNSKLVDNSFSAPEATGCGGPLSFLVDPLINSKLGLPSPGGTNTIIQNNTIKEATTIGVIDSEK